MKRKIYVRPHSSEEFKLVVQIHAEGQNVRSLVLHEAEAEALIPRLKEYLGIRV